MCTESPKDSVTVLYTGTRCPTIERPGLRIIYRPMLKSEALDFDLARIRRLANLSKTLVFYSPNAVAHLARSHVLDELDLRDKTTWAVGEKTAEALRDALALTPHVPDDPQFAGMLAKFDVRRPDLPLVAFGIQDSPRSLIGPAPGQFPPPTPDVHEVPIYRTTAQYYAALDAFINTSQIDWVALTSPRGVDAFVSHLTSNTLLKLRLAAIGPTTADAIRRHGLVVDLIPRAPDRNIMMGEIYDTNPSA